MTARIRIIGIDPGLGATGWGVIETSGNALGFLASGTVSTSAHDSLANRLVALHGGLNRVISAWSPDEAAVEATFVNKDGAATLKLGQARGICLLAPAQAGLPVAEYAPNLVKKSVVGAGHADKAQIRTMVKLLLPRAEFATEHAADALAIAICHAHHRAVSAAALGARMRVSA
ncbi:MAG: crossover junction endodeoxyribonuclease RuvC [Rhizobiaceae bacterium]|nr:crossover junction endodeoxyribonuclease RuvC [Rhizobiaceae bacterium]